MGIFDFLKKQKISDSICNASSSEITKSVSPNDSYLEKRVKFIKNKESEFENVLNSLDRYNIIFSSFEKLVLNYDIKYSTITSKTNINKIKDFVVIDTETTGLSSKSSIIELSAIKFIDFKPVEIFDTFIKPPRKIPESSTKINGITDEMVCNSPKLKDISQCFIDFVGDYNIVGHNLEFDLSVLKNKGIVFSNRKYFDTLLLAKKVLKKPKTKWDKEYEVYYTDYDSGYDVESYKLEDLCNYYEIYRSVSHHSDSDCLATGYLFDKLVHEII